MSDIKFRLGLDGKEFDQGLTRASKRAQDFANVAQGIHGKLKRAFGADDVFKGLLAGLGIGSAEKIVEKITEGFKEAADVAKNIAESTARTLGLYERLFSSRRTDAQNLDVNLRDQARLQRELAGTTEQRATQQRFDPVMGRPYSVEAVTREANPKRAAEIGEELARLAVEESELRKKITDDQKKQTDDLAKRREKVAKDEIELAREQMATEEQIKAVERDRLAIDYLLAEGSITALDAREKTVEIEKKLVALREKQTQAAEKEATEAKKAADLEKRRTEEIERRAKAILKAGESETAARKNLRDARAEQFAFSLGDAAQGTRGSRGGRSRAKLIAQKTGLMDQILDRGDYQVAFGDDGNPTLTSRDPGKQDAAKQATTRFRALHSDREALRGSINNLEKSDREPFAENIKAVEEAVKEVTEVLTEIRESKFANQ